MIFKKLLFTGALIGTISACGDERTPSVTGSLIVAAPPAPASLNSKGTIGTQSMTIADLPASDSSFSFAKIDGIKLTLKIVRGMDNSSGGELASVEVNQEITLTDDPNQSIALNQSASWGIGDYRKLEIYFSNTWQAKAYCKTQKTSSGTSDFKLVYTTAEGVEVIDCNSGNSYCATMPSDYDYYTYDTLIAYYKNLGEDAMTSNNISFTVAEGTSPKVQLLFDATNSLACWDGLSYSTNGEALGGFRSYNESEANAQFGGAAFTMAPTGFSLLGYVTTDANEGVPSARAFYTSSNQNNLATMDPSTGLEFTETLTILYNAAGTPVSASAQNASGTGNLMAAIPEGFTQNEDTVSWDFFLSGWYYSGVDNAKPEFIRNRQIVGFDPPGNFDDDFSANVKDGPGCGQTLSDFRGDNPSLSCLGEGSTQTYYFREAKR